MQITTQELLDAQQARTGLLPEQLLAVVVKSAAIRHLAGDPTYGDRFILKGGTLLAHVYQGSRQSIRDADYVHAEPASLTTAALRKAFTIDTEGFQVHADKPVWKNKGTYFEGKPSVVLDTAALEVSGVFRKRMKITVSVREGERLDRPDDDVELIYTDHLLASDQTFAVEGLTLNELSAEKILAWCSKPFIKHLVDLAGIARDHGSGKAIDKEHVAKLVRLKYDTEKNESRYQPFADLSSVAAQFDADERLEAFRAVWGTDDPAAELLLPQAEQDHPESLADPATVIRLARAFWGDTLDLLRA
jgi:hypothetical protein